MTFNENDVNREADGKFGHKTGSAADVKLLPSDLSDPEWKDYGRTMEAALQYAARPVQKAGGWDTISASGPVVSHTRNGELHNLTGPARITFEVDSLGELRQRDTYFVYGEEIEVTDKMFDDMEYDERKSLDAVGLPHEPSDNEHAFNSLMRDGISARAFKDTVLREAGKRARAIEEQLSGMSR